jgi:hypothetical protein
MGYLSAQNNKECRKFMEVNNRSSIESVMQIILK